MLRVFDEPDKSLEPSLFLLRAHDPPESRLLVRANCGFYYPGWLGKRTGKLRSIRIHGRSSRGWRPTLTRNAMTPALVQAHKGKVNAVLPDFATNTHLGMSLFFMLKIHVPVDITEEFSPNLRMIPN
jgi:hypothetical protein